MGCSNSNKIKKKNDLPEIKIKDIDNIQNNSTANNNEQTNTKSYNVDNDYFLKIKDLNSSKKFILPKIKTENSNNLTPEEIKFNKYISELEIIYDTDILENYHNIHTNENIIRENYESSDDTMNIKKKHKRLSEIISGLLNNNEDKTSSNLIIDKIDQVAENYIKDKLNKEKQYSNEQIISDHDSLYKAFINEDYESVIKYKNSQLYTKNSLNVLGRHNYGNAIYYIISSYYNLENKYSDKIKTILFNNFAHITFLNDNIADKFYNEIIQELIKSSTIQINDIIAHIKNLILDNLNYSGLALASSLINYLYLDERRYEEVFTLSEWCLNNEKTINYCYLYQRIKIFNIASKFRKEHPYLIGKNIRNSYIFQYGKSKGRLPIDGINGSNSNFKEITVDSKIDENYLEEFKKEFLLFSDLLLGITNGKIYFNLIGVKRFPNKSVNMAEPKIDLKYKRIITQMNIDNLILDDVNEDLEILSQVDNFYFINPGIQSNDIGLPNNKFTVTNGGATFIETKLGKRTVLISDREEVNTNFHCALWLIHESFHHLESLYSESDFVQEIDHPCNTKELWPKDYEGLYELDYYLESFNKRIKLSQPSLVDRWRFNNYERKEFKISSIHQNKQHIKLVDSIILDEACKVYPITNDHIFNCPKLLSENQNFRVVIRKNQNDDNYSAHVIKKESSPGEEKLPKFFNKISKDFNISTQSISDAHSLIYNFYTQNQFDQVLDLAYSQFVQNAPIGLDVNNCNAVSFILEAMLQLNYPFSECRALLFDCYQVYGSLQYLNQPWIIPNLETIFRNISSSLNEDDVNKWKFILKYFDIQLD